MLVPASAMGRVGLCPSCGAEVRITAQNTRGPGHTPDPARRPGSGLLGRHRAVARRVSEPREESWRKFAAAVDLYNAHRYAEALVLLDALLHDYPDNAHVHAARNECIAALHGAPALPRHYNDQPVPEQTLNADLVKSVVLEKLLHGDDATQLRAAELAARIVGLCGNGREALGDADAPLSRTAEGAQPESAGPSGDGNGDEAPRTAVRAPRKPARRARSASNETPRDRRDEIS